jgi:hypothetical protein
MQGLGSMRKLVGLAVLLAAGPVAAQSVNIDYARYVNFKSMKTFEYVPPQALAAEDPSMGQQIGELIEKKLSEGGLGQVSDGADLYVTYHLTNQQNQGLDTIALGYGGYGPGWAGWDAGVPTATTESTFPKGTLIVDAYRPSDKKLVWRGTGIITGPSKSEKRAKEIESILDELGGRWQKILKSEGKYEEETKSSR